MEGEEVAVEEDTQNAHRQEDVVVESFAADRGIPVARQSTSTQT